MDPNTASTFLWLAPRVVVYATIAVAIAWLGHLLEPALTASFSQKYDAYPWVKGERGLLQFFSIVHECVFHAGGLFKSLYEKMRNSTNKLFLIPFPHSNTGFMLLLPVDLIGEYAKQPEDVVSFDKYVREVMHARYSLFGDNMLDNNIQKPIVRKELVQKLRFKIDMMNEEMVAALNDALTSQMDKNGEIRINVWDTAMKFLSRTSNRIIVGYPLCRNEEYLEATIDYAVNMFSLAIYNDLLTAVMKVAKNDPNSHIEYTPMMLVNRVLTFNFLQSYSNTLTFSNAMYDLVGLPQGVFDETVADLREEVASALKEAGGYNADFVGKLDFMDSFYRESLRSNPVGDVGLERTIVSEGGFTFSNGLHVPKGATLAAPIRGIQTDQKYYPGGFNPRRALEDPARPKVTTLSPDFLIFGLGRPACPGRWFAITLQKLAMSHILMDYDIECLGKRPQGVRKVTLIEPRDRTRRIVLRKRKSG
ncbi:hypothetical protein SLS62_009446 [Diatrype stigma]|uniref:Cytochrome P450 n=1 Tax=Diatrype stigma TaxID=117547 RepID=A0AAN9UGS9_9PEZI